jgi:hypothetical protein
VQRMFQEYTRFRIYRGAKAAIIPVRLPGCPGGVFRRGRYAHFPYSDSEPQKRSFEPPLILRLSCRSQRRMRNQGILPREK